MNIITEVFFGLVFIISSYLILLLNKPSVRNVTVYRYWYQIKKHLGGP